MEQPAIELPTPPTLHTLWRETAFDGRRAEQAAIDTTHWHTMTLSVSTVHKKKQTITVVDQLGPRSGT